MAMKEFIKVLKENHISMVKRLVYARKMRKNGQCHINGYTYVIC